MRLRGVSASVCLALALVLGSGLVAARSPQSGAYFSDTRSGVISGSYRTGDVTPPCALTAGASKQMHWSSDDKQVPGEPIAQLETCTDTIFLRFGDAPPGHGETKPDVLRIESLVADARSVRFELEGAAAGFVTDVHLGQGSHDVVEGGDTRPVSMKVHIPDDAAPGVYRGVLIIRVEGWTVEVRCPMTFEVDMRRPKASSEDSKAAAKNEWVDPGDAPAGIVEIDLSAPMPTEETTADPQAADLVGTEESGQSTATVGEDVD